jgi:hypothetical protein
VALVLFILVTLAVASVFSWALTAWSAQKVHDTITRLPVLNPSPSPSGPWIDALQGH